MLVPRTLPIGEAKAHFAECVRQAERGETIVLTRHGRTVARIVADHSGEVREPAGRYDAGPAEAPFEAETSIETRLDVRTAGSRRESLGRFLEETIWPRIPDDQLGRGPGKSEREEILGFGSTGF